MTKIMIVDDDPNIRILLRNILEREGLEIIEAVDGEEALLKSESVKVDLYILDIMMPKMNGWELCETLKSVSDVPILMLTAMGETMQKIKGFELGTDDYLVKPFEPLELVMRVKALLKRYRIAISQTIQLGVLELNARTFEATLQGEKINLPMKEFELLFMLGSYVGKTLSRDQLIEQIWGYDYEGDERTVDVHIKRLRERFDASKLGFKITTIRGLGYRLEVV